MIAGPIWESEISWDVDEDEDEDEGEGEGEGEDEDETIFAPESFLSPKIAPGAAFYEPKAGSRLH